MQHKGLFSLARRLPAAALSAALCLALCACGGGGSAAGSGEPGSVPAGSPPEGGTQAALHAVTASAESGRYSVGYRDGDYSKPIVTWVDYEQLVQVPLCADPGCAHDHEGCTAWLGTTDGGEMGNANVYALGDGRLLEMLAVIEPEGDLVCTMYLCNADGSDPRPVASNFNSPPFPCADDGQNVWYTAHVETPDSYTQGLYRASVNGGDPALLTPMSLEARFLGVYGRSIVYYERDTSVADAIPMPDWENDDQAVVDEYYEKLNAAPVRCDVLCVDVDSGAITTLASWEKPMAVDASLWWQDDTVYTLFSDEAALHIVPAGGEERVVPFTWPTEQAYYATIQAVLRGQVIIDAADASLADDGGNNFRVAVDAESGAVQKLALEYTYYGGTTPLTILDRRSDEVLVEFELQDQGGMPVARCGLLSLDDFFADEPNYREIVLPYGQVLP